MAAASAQADSVVIPVAGDENAVPAYLIEVPSSVSDVLVADAQGSVLIRFARTDDGIVERDTSYMSVGQNGVGKQRAWDKKTPLGIYFITDQLDTSRLAAQYGEAAFVLDYPNAWDIVNERTGHGIWLHGVDPKSQRRPKRDTDGCLALSNDALLSIAERLKPNVTPVIIAREVAWTSKSDIARQRTEFRAALEAWRSSLEAEDVYAYLSLYDEGFAARGMDKQQWAAFKLGVFAVRDLSAVVLGDVLLLRDPEVDGLYLSRFQQTLQTADGPVTLRKRLYWRRDGSDWRIVSEDVG